MAAKVKKPAKKKTVKRAAAPTKAETVENGMSLLMGDNGPPSKDLLYHLDQIAGYMDKAKTAQTRVTEAKKKAKDAGVDVKAITDTLTELRMDPLDLAHRMHQKATLWREKGMPIQMSLYEPKFGSIEEQAKTEGWQDGINARNINLARWPEGAPGHIEYNRRWNDAQAENASKISQA